MRIALASVSLNLYCSLRSHLLTGGIMSYNQDIFIDSCVMRLVQIACAIRQTCERSEQEFDADEIECQAIDACEEQYHA